MRNLPRLVSLSLAALPAALLLSACGGDSVSSSAPAAGNAVPSAPLPQAAAPEQATPGGAPGETPQADAGDAPIQPSDYKPDPTYLPDDSHLGAVS
ncbi:MULTISPECIES: hypothetical protein [Asticcacaulis]|uniref:hypothetical protein n=1 Tax=Asticcacaulis TaxID=76890 RepID=UPI001AE1EB78|nr:MULTISPECIES: hypothetical protein [Asticcacaulis]MBP2159758.1 hypothetical protein [Asticcacaulis solisilvae]MDR6800803.1 hypothetical protein [Asticcacaulis sp. BE141]